MGFFDRYPYTNWHNVNLDWVLERVKEWGQMVEANDQAFRDLEEANASFKEYVTNYLQNLDVQAEIDDKLDRMFESGELTDYLEPYISSSVTTWLDENITEPTGVIIDRSLTVSGACADAKATGDRLNAEAFNSTAKQDLLSILEKIAYTDSHMLAMIRSFENSLLNGSDFYNKWIWNLSEIQVVGAGVDITDDGRLSMNRTQSSSRKTFVVSHGAYPFLDYTTGNITEFFPIPIPAGASEYTIEWTPSTLYFNSTPLAYIGSARYTRIPSATQGWTTGGNYTHTLNSVNQNMRALIINSKYDSAGTSYPITPSSVKVTFN